MRSNVAPDRRQDISGLPPPRPAPYLAVMHTQVTPENLRELVGRFYGRAREDALIGPVFNAAIDDWDHHLDHIAQFWAAGLLGVGRFTIDAQAFGSPSARGDGQLAADIVTEITGWISVSYDYTPTVGNLPEPATMALVGIAVLGMGGLRRRRAAGL